jgi:4-amino-4-deoxy-L-arabinose transferase-like glycosyltransferase
MEGLKAGAYQKYAVPAFLFLFLAIVAAWAAGFGEEDFTNPDAYDYAQMGREIRRGHGLSTRQLFPRHIPFMAARGYLNSEHIPNLNRYPLPTIANAFFQLFSRNVARAAVLQSGVWFLASIPVLFLLARRLTNPIVALLSTLVYAANSSAWGSSYNGMTESLATLLVLLLAYVIFVPEPTRWKYLAAGLLCGLAFLSRTQLAFLFPLAAALLWFMVPRPNLLRALTWLAAGFLLVTLPWMIRNTILAGDPLFSFTTTRAFVLGTDVNNPDLELLLHAPVRTAEVFLHYGPEIVAKIRANIWPNILNPVAWIGSATFALMIWLGLAASRLVPDERRPAEYVLFRNSVIVLILANFLTVSLVLFYDRFFEFLYPFIIVIALQEGYLLLQAAIPARGRTAALKAVTVLLLVAGLVRAREVSMRYAGSQPMESADAATFQILADLIEPDSVVASDISHKITLYDDLLTVRLPVNPDELLDISQNYLPIDYVVFSSKITDADPRTHSTMFGNYTGYQGFMRSAAFLQNYELVRKLPNGAVLYRQRK